MSLCRYVFGSLLQRRHCFDMSRLSREHYSWFGFDPRRNMISCWWNNVRTPNFGRILLSPCAPRYSRETVEHLARCLQRGCGSVCLGPFTTVNQIRFLWNNVSYWNVFCTKERQFRQKHGKAIPYQCLRTFSLAAEVFRTSFALLMPFWGQMEVPRGCIADSRTSSRFYVPHDGTDGRRAAVGRALSPGVFFMPWRYRASGTYPRLRPLVVCFQACHLYKRIVVPTRVVTIALLRCS